MSLKQNIFDWYSSEYPNDYQLDKINRTVTFKDLERYEGSMYDLIGKVDSLVIDRIIEQFEKL